MPRERILLIEDEARLRYNLRILLGRDGSDMTGADNSDQGLAYVLKAPLDISMSFSIFKRLALSRAYAFVTLLCVALVSLSPAWFLARSIETRMLERDATVSMQGVQTIADHLDVRTDFPSLPSSHPSLSHDKFFVPTNMARINAVFGAFAQRLYRQPDIIRINVYAPDGMRIWSTNPRLIGQRDLSNALLVRALIGQLAVRVKHTVQDIRVSEQARVASRAPIFSEMYLPILNASRDTIIGVVELYKASDTLFQTIAQSQKWIWGGAIVGGILLYSVLLGFKRWALRAIAQWRERRRILLPPPKTFYKLYAALSLLFAILLIVVPTWSLAGYMDRRMLERDATVTMQFIQTLLEDMDAGAYLPVPSADKHTPTYADFFIQTDPERIHAIFSDFSKRVPLEQLDIVRISVYAPDGMRIWATQPEQVGIRWLGNAELVSALNGELAVKRGIVIHGLTAVEKKRITSNPPVYSEMYMPIWDPARDTVVGVIEVYKDSTVLFNLIAQGQGWFWGITIGLGLLLLGVLLSIMRRAVRVLEQQREKLVEAETLTVVGEMVSSIAHLLRQPLDTISASSNSMLEQGCRVIEPQVRDIQAEIHHLQMWLLGLQPYDHQQEDICNTLDLPIVLYDLIKQVKDGFDKQNIRIQLDIPDTLPSVQADPAVIQQVFHIVITNAQDAMPDGGTLSIRAASIDQSPFIDIEISDTGHGMTTEQLDQAFRPFFTTKRRGLGVGLALARRVIERQGGRIAIKSIAGQGTMVTVSFPMGTRDGAGDDRQGILRSFSG